MTSQINKNDSEQEKSNRRLKEHRAFLGIPTCLRVGFGGGDAAFVLDYEGQ